MPHRLISFPQFDAFTSPNEGEDRRYVLARTAVLHALVQGPTIKAVFVRWEKAAGLMRSATNVAVAEDLTAREKACNQFKKRIGALPKAVLLDAARVAAQLKPKLPWPWVIQGLVHVFMLQCSAVAVGAPFSLSQAVEETSINLQGVPASISKRELFDLHRAARQPRLHGSRVPKKNAESIRRNARWFVRKEIGGVSMSDLAREYHAAHHGNLAYSDCPNDRAIVYHGIRETKRLLELTSYRLGSSPLKK